MLSSKSEQFLNDVCAQIRWRRWRGVIRQELAAHLEDRIEYLITERGFSLPEAEAEAVRLMGDPCEIGRALDMQHRPWQFILFISLTMAFWGAILYAAYLLVCNVI